VWAGSDLLACVNGENLARLYNLAKDDNYVLALRDERHLADPKDLVRTLAFNPRTRTLAGGCKNKRVVFWRFIKEGVAQDGDPSEEDWDVLPPVDLTAGGGDPLGLVWGPGEGLMGVNTGKAASVLNKTTLHCKTQNGCSAIQMSSDAVFLVAPGASKRVQTKIRIKGMDVNDHCCVLWSGKKVEVREMGSGSMPTLAIFNSRARACALKGQDLYCINGQRIEICNLSGVVKKSISFTEAV
jgi:hypothetical protein